MNLSDITTRKFIESYPVSEWEIETDTGWQDITHSHKTIPYEIYHLTLENEMFLKCADTHIIFTSEMQEIFVKDCIPFITRIKTKEGDFLVTSVIATGEYENMYDFTVDSPTHRFYSNGILSHNTTTATCILLHYVLFSEHKLVALLANKEATAIEILSRIQLAYEYLPKWLQSGVLIWNKKSIKLENGCKIIASATSGSAIRGQSCVGGDTFVQVQMKEYPHKEDWIMIRELVGKEKIYKIYDGECYRNFDEILVQEKKLYQINCENGHIDATDDHRFLDIHGEWKYVRDLHAGDELQIAGKFLNKRCIGEDLVYDPINVEGTNRYQSNNFISHNCSYVYIDECVVGDTSITVRDITTGEIKKITIEELYNEKC